jgi:hypothetical protein
MEISRSGRGGVRHRYWQHRFQELFADAGGDATIEGRDADVWVDGDAAAVAVEVAMQDREREADHVAERMDAGADLVLVAARSDVVADELRDRLRRRGLLDGRVHVGTVRSVVSAVEDMLADAAD